MNAAIDYSKPQGPPVVYHQEGVRPPRQLSRINWMPLRSERSGGAPDLRVLQGGGGGGEQRQITLSEDIRDKDGHVIYKAGQQLQLAVSPADTSDQFAELDTYLGGYVPFGLGADRIAPIVLVDKETGKRRDFDRENAFEIVETRTGRQGTINELDHMSSRGDYETEEHALAAFIPWAAENDAEPLYRVKEAHSEMIGWKLAMAHEVRVINLATTLASWAAANRTSLGATTYWDTGSSKNPRADLLARMKASSTTVREIFMNPDVGFWFLSDAEVRQALRIAMGDDAPKADTVMASNEQGVMTFNIAGYPPITILPGKRIPVAGGDLEYILGDDVILVGGPRTPPTDGRGVGSLWTYRTRGPSGTGFTTNEYIPMGRGLEGGTLLEQGYKETTFMGSIHAGGLIKDVLST